MRDITLFLFFSHPPLPIQIQFKQQALSNEPNIPSQQSQRPPVSCVIKHRNLSTPHFKQCTKIKERVLIGLSGQKVRIFVPYRHRTMIARQQSTGLGISKTFLIFASESKGRMHTNHRNKSHRAWSALSLAQVIT